MILKCSLNNFFSVTPYLALRHRQTKTVHEIDIHEDGKADRRINRSELEEDRRKSQEDRCEEMSHLFCIYDYETNTYRLPQAE